jgi:hypothetical protein
MLLPHLECGSACIAGQGANPTDLPERQPISLLRSLLSGPIREVVACLIEVRSMGYSGLDLLAMSLSRFDPNRTWGGGSMSP